MSSVGVFAYLLWHVWLFGGYLLLFVAVVVHPWRKCINYLWWWVLCALVTGSWAAEEAFQGRILAAALMAGIFVGACVGVYRILDTALERASGGISAGEWRP